ncbi:inhibin beta C chain [Myripristis murdjan]|uniref:Inhibin beta C chain-like n=1 Tax=Myripristis murdjan TaxID=586833 RepID=A0A667ZBT7_9TELE|nr:inhibin beta C chain-like [Myripristis murdjan]
MLRSRSLHCLLSCMLILIFLSSPGEGRPHTAQEDAPDMESKRVLLLEAVKSGILNSLGMDKAPRPTEKASHHDLRKMYQLYRETLRQLRGNSSHSMQESWHPTVSTVLFPATVEPIKVIWKSEEHPKTGQRLQWYRAIFHKNANLQTQLTLTRAELKISRQILDKHTPMQPERRQDIQVNVNGMKPINSAEVTHTDHANASSTQDVTLDIMPEVERWRSDADQSLVVDVGVAAGKRRDHTARLSIALEIDLLQSGPARSRRRPRSNKEDICDEEGYCCRKAINVSFKDIGWSDWVVAPASYTMHFCDGTCPHNYKPASMHTQVKSRLHQITKGGTPHPCCVPAAYEPMVLMHYDSQGKLKLTPFDDLIVSKCYCA